MNSPLHFVTDPDSGFNLSSERFHIERSVISVRPQISVTLDFVINRFL